MGPYWNQKSFWGRVWVAYCIFAYGTLRVHRKPHAIDQGAVSTFCLVVLHVYLYGFSSVVVLTCIGSNIIYLGLILGFLGMPDATHLTISSAGIFLVRNTHRLKTVRSPYSMTVACRRDHGLEGERHSPMA